MLSKNPQNGVAGKNQFAANTPPTFIPVAHSKGAPQKTIKRKHGKKKRC